jgi:hypothetical protein
VGNTLEAIGKGKDFLSKTQLVQQLRERIDKWDYMKLHFFCTAKEMVSKLQRPHTECQKNLFHLYIKVLIIRIYRKLEN